MTITLLCPRLGCRALLRVPDTVRGQRVRCAECGMAFVVPQSAKSPANRGKQPTEQQKAAT